MQAPKGFKPAAAGKGRPLGSKNKFPSAIKDKIIHTCNVLEAAGKDLASVALEKPEWFYENFVKPSIPKDLNLSGNINVNLQMILSDDD